MLEAADISDQNCLELEYAAAYLAIGVYLVPVPLQTLRLNLLEMANICRRRGFYQGGQTIAHLSEHAGQSSIIMRTNMKI
jgi:hypothetical protein